MHKSLGGGPGSCEEEREMFTSYLGALCDLYLLAQEGTLLTSRIDKDDH
jgi:hypothetical protein